MLLVVLIAVPSPACERHPAQREHHEPAKIDHEPPQDGSMDTSKDRNDAAESTFAKLSAGEEESSIAGLGTFSVRKYKAYEGRNPRTGETVRVPGKSLPFYMPDGALREYVNGAGPRPSVPWIAAMVDQLRGGTPVVFGRLGVFVARTKPEANGRDPGSRKPVVIPARTVMTFRPSSQLARAVEGQPELRMIDSAALEAALAKLPATAPRTLTELDTELARLGIEHVTADLLAPSERTREEDGSIALTSDDEQPWMLVGGKVVASAEDAEDTIEASFERWSADKLLVVLVQSVANGGVLRAADLERLLARLGPDSPFSSRDLPF
jgi:nucleoid DNA-binding protein